MQLDIYNTQDASVRSSHWTQLRQLLNRHSPWYKPMIQLIAKLLKFLFLFLASFFIWSQKKNHNYF